MTRPLLARPCPWCSAAYAEHDLEGLAACVEGMVAGEQEELELDEVDGPTLRSVL